MIVLAVAAIAAVVLLASGFGQLPQNSIVRPPRTGRWLIDDTLADVYRNPTFADLALSARDAAGFRSAIARSTDAQLERMTLGLPIRATGPELRQAFELDTMFEHVYEGALVTGGDCQGCTRSPWAGVAGRFVLVDDSVRPVLDHLLGLA